MLRYPTGAVDAAKRVGAGLNEPNAAARVQRHGARLAVLAGNRELAHHPLDGDPADAVAGGLAEPKIAVGARNDADRQAVPGGDGVLRKRISRRIEAADTVSPLLAKPKAAIRPWGRDMRPGTASGHPMLPDRDALRFPRGAIHHRLHLGENACNPSLPNSVGTRKAAALNHWCGGRIWW